MMCGVILLFLFFVGCAGAIQSPEPIERTSIADGTDVAFDMPDYVKTSDGAAVALMEGKTAPFDGVLYDQSKAFNSAKLRIAYDELYQLSGVQKAAFNTSIRIIEDELEKADLEVARKNEALRELQSSWWAQHKLTVGVITGVIIGVAGSFGAGVVWSKLDD